MNVKEVKSLVHYIFSACLFVLFFMLFSQKAYAAPLSMDEVKARYERGEALTEKERLETLESIYPGKTELRFGSGYVELSGDGRKVLLKKIPMDVTNRATGEKTSYDVPLTDSHLSVFDDVIMIRDKSGGTLSAGSSISLGACDVYPGNNTLQEGSVLLVLDTNGTLHGYLAGATGNGSVTLGDKLNVFRCIGNGRIQTAVGEFAPSFPLPAFGDTWGWSDRNSVNSGLGEMIWHLDVDMDSKYYVLPEFIIHDCSVEIKYDDITVDLQSGEADIGHEIPITENEIGWKEIISIGQTLSFSISGSGKGTTKFSMGFREGFNLSFFIAAVVPVIEDAGWNHHDPDIKVKSTDMDGEVYLGIADSEELTFLSTASIGPNYKTGFVVEGEKSEGHNYPGDDEKKYWHECESGECVHGSGFWRLGPLALSWSMLGQSETIISTDPKDFDPFFEFYDSKTFDDRDWTSCPHKGYRLNAQVLNSGGDPLSEANVSYSPVKDHYDGATSKETDASGKAVLYAPTGDIEVTATITSKKDRSITYTQTQPLTKTADTQDITFNIEIPSKKVSFKNPASGEAKNWPADISFTPFYSEEVDLPGTIPELSGYQFTGWNTKEDGSGTTYAPGTSLTLKDDLTLWAQWELASDSWYVIYNANGGKKAPMPTITRKGTDAALTSELPEAGKMIFKGWTPDPRGLNPVYQRGDTLPYDSGKNYVVLYALWDLSPVPQPIHVSFNANGLEQASIPADAWMEQGTWMQLEAAVAPLGSEYSFLGWSEDPASKDPEYQAYRSYYFYRSTALYAIWDNLDTLTLSFEDSLPGGASGIPEAISILSTMSRNVMIPGDIPQKSGRIFTGWNTAKDGSGSYYAPGSTLDLKNNTTLWAQWEMTGDSWYVIYNANGGTKAPMPTISQKGTDAVLTSELPEAGRMIFKGWTPDPRGLNPVYQRGDTLPYDSSKNYVVLYALWDLSPVPQPIHVSFNANGLEQASIPADIWMEQGNWLQLGSAIAPLGSNYTFLGWSENPASTDPEFKANRSYYFYRSTALYAIWTILDTVTLSFKDSLPGDASGIPDAISILPSMSRTVRIPGDIPQKSGRVFIGWNTEKDGSGSYYAPGSSLVLGNNVTLWAQWDIAGNSWYIIYNANGGINAPRPGIARIGENYVLSEEMPIADNMVFDGWSTDPNAQIAAYRPGETLTYDSQKSYIVLYAVWHMATAHTHKYVWDKIEATADEDGELRYQCEICGDIQERVPLSAYYIFNLNAVESIQKAQKNATVKIDTRRWISFHHMVMDALAERPDVTVEITFLDGGHKGNKFKVIIPKGADTKALVDTNGFTGFLFLGGKFGITQQ